MCGESCVLGTSQKSISHSPCPEHFSTFLLPQRLRSYTKVFGAVHKSDFGLITWEPCILDTWFWDEIVPDFLLLPWKRIGSNYPDSFIFHVFLVVEFGLVSSVLSFFPSAKSQISNNLSLNLKRCSFCKISGIYSEKLKLFKTASPNGINYLLKQSRWVKEPLCPRCCVQQAKGKLSCVHPNYWAWFMATEIS